MARALRAPCILCALCTLLAPSTAAATQSASIRAALTPERLGDATTLSLTFRFGTGAGQIPSPLTGLDVHYPADLGIATSELGLAACPIARLQAEGPSSCPPDSRVGSGSALVEVPVGGGTEAESASIALLTGPPQDGYTQLLISATGRSPVIAQIVIPALMLAGELKLTVPPIESLPGGPNVSVVRIHVDIGGRLTYYERRHGRLVAYHPQDILLPRSCPRGGFRFSASFSFQDGTTERAQTAVACPRKR